SAGECEPLQELPFGETGATANQATITTGYMGIVFEYGETEDTIPALSPDQGGAGHEFWITNKIRNIRDKTEGTAPHIGIIKRDGITLDHGDLVPASRGASPTLRGIFTQHFPFYTF